MWIVDSSVGCLIATFIIARGFALLHSDHDSEPFAQHLGLVVVQTQVG